MHYLVYKPNPKIAITKSKPHVKPKIPATKAIPTVKIPANKSKHPVKPTTVGLITAASSIKPSLVVIDISKDRETDSHNQEIKLKSVVTIAEIHHQPKEKATNTKLMIQPQTAAPVKENKSQPLRR